MVESVHMVTSAGGSGGRKTSTANETTEIGYETLKIIDSFDNRSEFDISSVKPNLNGILSKYLKAHPHEDKKTLRAILDAEISAFITMGLIARSENVHRVFGSQNDQNLTLTDKGRERIAAYDNEQKEKADALKKAPSGPAEDPLIIKEMHFSVLAAVRSFVNEDRPDGSTKVYIVTKAINGNNNLREEAKKAFETLQEHGCFIEKQLGSNIHIRFKLSAIGERILEEKPKIFLTSKEELSMQTTTPTKTIKAPTQLALALLKATSKYDKPTFQQYIVERSIYSIAQRATANQVFEILVEKGYFDVTQSGKRPRDSFALSTAGKAALNDSNFDLDETVEVPLQRKLG